MKREAVELTNMKTIMMIVRDENGRGIKLMPGKTVCVEGDYARYRAMMKSMNGLVVKKATGRVALMEGADRPNPTRLVKITNHRSIPAVVDTGIRNRRVKIGPGETSDPVMAKVNTVKSINGLSIEIVADKAEKDAEGGSDATKKAAEAAAAKEAAEQAKVEAEKAEAEAKVAAKTDELAEKRRELGLADTAEGWAEQREQMTWPDVRAVAKELGIKTKKKSKEELLESITSELYPE